MSAERKPMTVIVTTRDEFAALLDTLKAANLPSSMTWQDRRRAEDVMRRARGWLRSTFFRVEAAETQQHIDAITSVRGAASHG
jgi:hypothetical protein